MNFRELSVGDPSRGQVRSGTAKARRFLAGAIDQVRDTTSRSSELAQVGIVEPPESGFAEAEREQILYFCVLPRTSENFG